MGTQATIKVSKAGRRIEAEWEVEPGHFVVLTASHRKPVLFASLRRERSEPDPVVQVRTYAPFQDVTTVARMQVGRYSMKALQAFFDDAMVIVERERGARRHRDRGHLQREDGGVAMGVTATRKTGAERAANAVKFIRENGAAGVTVQSVRDFTETGSETEAILAIVEVMGADWAAAQGIVPDGDVVSDGRRFAVVRGGRRWTKVPEYMSNDQRTARWFVDETTGEVRMARSWKAPESWPMSGDRAAFVLAIVAQAT